MAPDVGPASSTSSVTRATSTKSIVPLEATDSETVSTFDYFRLEGPPAAKESQGNMTARNTRNIIKMTDIMDNVEGRVRRERNVDNMSMELKVRTGVRTANDSDDHSPPAEGARGHARRDSDSTGSIGTVDEVEALGERVQGMDKQLKDTVSSTEDHKVRIQELDSRVRILETQLVSLATPEFSILEMSTALSDQFTVVRQKHDALGDVVKLQGVALAKANKQHDLTFAEMQAKNPPARVHACAPPTRSNGTSPPRSPPTRPPRAIVRPRSRSPELSISAKRFHGHSTQDKPFIVMGPVEITESTPPLQILHVYMNAHLPKFALPEPPLIDVIRDPRQADHLRIIMSAADVRALKNAWVEKGYNSGSVRMVAMGLDDAAGFNSVVNGSGTSGIDYGRYFQSGNPGRSESKH
ncbi:hypothetical protein MVEN_00051200 [Mycena venus]|uniref:Uncharacterized protein n=1 Tax=Mycena venus TaxID=2733690 RepID=A0A8H6Z419_9AGAR|nr:hypothetical protein MVEN_00051200 [Mycena venus]